MDFKLGQKVDAFTIGSGLNYLSLIGGGIPELIFDPVIWGSSTGTFSVYDTLNFGFNRLKGSDNITLNLSNNIIEFNLTDVYTSAEADAQFATLAYLNTLVSNYYGKTYIDTLRLISMLRISVPRF